MQESIYDDVSPLYQEAITAYRDFLLFPHEGETLKLLEIRATHAAIRLFAEEGKLSIDLLYREIDLTLGALQLMKQQESRLTL